MLTDINLLVFWIPSAKRRYFDVSDALALSGFATLIRDAISIEVHGNRFWLVRPWLWPVCWTFSQSTPGTIFRSLEDRQKVRLIPKA